MELPVECATSRHCGIAVATGVFAAQSAVSNAIRRMNPTAKGQAAHASLRFRLAELQEDACTSELVVASFGLTIVDGTVTVDPAEVAVPRELFAAILDGIQQFGVPPPLVQRG